MLKTRLIIRVHLKFAYSWQAMRMCGSWQLQMNE